MRFYFSKTTIQYHAIRHKKDNEHREDGTYRSYAVDVHLPKEKQMDYIIGEDEQGKFLKFEKNGAQATIRFVMTDSGESVAAAKRILGGVFERMFKDRLDNGEL